MTSAQPQGLFTIIHPFTIHLRPLAFLLPGAPPLVRAAKLFNIRHRAPLLSQDGGEVRCNGEIKDGATYRGCMEGNRESAERETDISSSSGGGREGEQEGV